MVCDLQGFHKAVIEREGTLVVLLADIGLGKLIGDVSCRVRLIGRDLAILIHRDIDHGGLDRGAAVQRAELSDTIGGVGEEVEILAALFRGHPGRELVIALGVLGHAAVFVQLRQLDR